MWLLPHLTCKNGVKKIVLNWVEKRKMKNLKSKVMYETACECGGSKDGLQGCSYRGIQRTVLM